MQKGVTPSGLAAGIRTSIAWRSSAAGSLLAQQTGSMISGPALSAYLVVGILVGGLGAGVGLYELKTTWSGTTTQSVPPGPPVTFTLKAYMTGFIGVGGSINGARDPTLTVQQGSPVTIVVIDGEAQIHNLHVDTYNVGTRNLGGVNDTASVTFTADTEGTFAYYCTIPGHRQAGMEGKVVVGEAGGTPIGPELPLTTPFISHDPTVIPPPIERNTSATVNIWLHAVEETAEIEPGTSFTYWTYNGTVPGPFFRVRQGDTVIVHFSNDRTSMMNHSVDFHAVTGPGGGGAVTQTPPGSNATFSFTALVPGLFVYHCATPNIPTHIAMGMYGEILVQPPQGLPPVDHEFYLMQGELYTQWPLHSAGNQLFNGTGLLNVQPTYVVFGGRYNAYTANHSLHVSVNDSVRIFFGVGGPNLISSFHMIGAMFDETYWAGDLTDPPLANLQTVLVAPGSTAMMDFTAMYPGNYPLVDHSIVNAMDKGALAILNVTGWANQSIFHVIQKPSPSPAMGGPTAGVAAIGRAE